MYRTVQQFLPVLLVSFLGGCQALQLENRTVRQSATLSDLQYKQVMANLAVMVDNPSALPYYAVAQTGKTTIQQNTQGSTGVNWDLLTVAGSLFNKVLFDKGSFGLQYNQQNIEEWDTLPALDPVQLILMQGLYRKALGYGIPDGQRNALERFFYVNLPTTPGTKAKIRILEYDPAGPAGDKLKSVYRAPPGSIATLGTPVANKLYFVESGKEDDQKSVDDKNKDKDKDKNKNKNKENATGGGPHKDYPDPFRELLKDVYNSIGPGSFGTGKCKDVPKCARYVGRHGNTFVWVLPDGLDALTNLTIAILDVSTADTSGLGTTGGTAGEGGGSALGGAGLRPRIRLNVVPQAIAPTP